MNCYKAGIVAWILLTGVSQSAEAQSKDSLTVNLVNYADSAQWLSDSNYDAHQGITIRMLRKDVLINKLQAINRTRELDAMKLQRLALGVLSVGLLLILCHFYRLLVRTRTLQQQTERQNQLIESQVDELKAVNVSKDKLFSIISHDLRSPIASLQYVLTEVQQMSHPSERWSLVVTRLTDQTNQLSQLINNLLYWSLTQQGLLKSRMEWVPIADVISYSQNLYKDTINRKELVMQVSGPPMQIWASENQLQLIVRNLIDNAVKFSPVGSAIQINWMNGLTGCQLLVYNKVALAEERTNGANLGLRVIKELVENQGGTLIINSKNEYFWQVIIQWSGISSYG